jgi:glucose dehydrogenase
VTRCDAQSPSRDGKGHLQVNPIIVDGVLYGPTPGGAIVALDAATGTERWRFKPEGRPAQRGLICWPGSAGVAPRIYFLTPRFLYALDARTGKPATFGVDGRVSQSRRSNLPLHSRQTMNSCSNLSNGPQSRPCVSRQYRKVSLRGPTRHTARRRPRSFGGFRSLSHQRGCQ